MNILHSPNYHPFGSGPSQGPPGQGPGRGGQPRAPPGQMPAMGPGAAGPTFKPRLGFQVLNAPFADGVIAWRWGMGELINSVSITPDGNLIIVACGYNVYAFDRDGNVKWAFQTNGYVYGTEISMDGSTIVVASKDMNFYCLRHDASVAWKIKTGQAMINCGLSHDGGLIIATTERGSIYCYDRVGEIVWRQNAAAPCYGLAVAANGETIVVGSEDYKVTTYSRLGKPIWAFITGSFVRNVSCSQRAEYILVSSRDKNLYCLDMSGGLHWKYSTGEYVLGVGISKDFRVLMAGIGQSLALFDTDGRLLMRFNMGDVVNNIALNFNGKAGVFSCGDGLFYIGKPIKQESNFVRTWKYNILGFEEEEPTVAPLPVPPIPPGVNVSTASPVIKAGAPKVVPSGGFCRYCGTQIPQGSVFCPKCGQRV